MRLHLDGAYALNQFMEAEKEELGEQVQRFTSNAISARTLRAHKVWSRISQPLHFALIIIRTLSTQACRGTSSIVSGVLTFDFHGKIVSGLKDYLSLLIEAVALPLLTIGVIFKPRVVKNCLEKMEGQLDVGSGDRNWSRSSHYEIIEGYSGLKPWAQKLWVEFPRMITGIPNILVGRSTLGVQAILHGRVKEAGKEFL